MPVEHRHITAADLILARVAFSRGEEADPAETLRDWRREEGFADGSVETASQESAAHSIREIEELIEAGGTLSLTDVQEFLRREYEHALMLGWIVRARRDAGSDQGEVSLKDVAEQAEREVMGGG